LDEKDRLEVLRRLPQQSPVLKLATKSDRKAVQTWRQKHFPPMPDDPKLLQRKDSASSSGLEDDAADHEDSDTEEA
jgi:hypothetical protein